MASFVYVPEAAAILSARFITNAALADIRIRLESSNTNADTEEDTQFLSAFTLDTFNGANYGSDKALASEAVNTDTTNDRGEFDAADLTAGGTGWTALGAGTRSIVGILGYHFVTNDAASPAAWWDDSASQLPFNGNGSDVGITWNAEGIIQATTV